MATSRELRDMADQLDWEAEQYSTMSDGCFPIVLVGRLTGPRSGQSKKRPGYIVQACQRAWTISASISQQVAAKAPKEVEEVEAQGGKKATSPHTPG